MLRISYLVIFSAIWTSTLVSAQEPPLNNSSIRVSGTAAIEVAPNQMKWSLTISNDGKEIDKVADAHPAIVAKVVALLQDNKVAKSSIRATDMSLQVSWKRTHDGPERDGFVAVTKVEVTSSDLSKYKEVWIGMSRISGVTINHVRSDHSERIKYQEQAQEKAVQTAKAKAIRMAGAIGATIGDPLSIEEGNAEESSEFNSGALSNSSTGDLGGAPEDTLGRIKIRASVNVTFRLKGAKDR